MKRILVYLLLSLSCSTVFATVTKSTLAASPDEYYERAREKSEELVHISDEAVKLEGSGELDPKKSAEMMKEFEARFLAFKYDLKMAAEGGHTVATYLLGNLESTLSPTTEERNRFCALFKTAMDQGLLAAGVTYFYQCDIAYMRFDMKNPGHLKYLGELKQMLHRVDGNRDDYPLPAKRSVCFKSQQAVSATQMTRAEMLESISPTLLTYDQYRAEAYYILAGMAVNDKGLLDSQNLVWLNQALALGCKDTRGLKGYYEKEFGAQTAK